jgi:hypothetical protein
MTQPIDRDQAQKLAYRGPSIVEAGDVVTLTGRIGTPVRDNLHVDPPHYYDANPPGGPESFTLDLEEDA